MFNYLVKRSPLLAILSLVFSCAALAEDNPVLYSTSFESMPAGPSAYSSLTICKDGSIGVLYEPGYGAVRFVSFTLEDLTEGADQLSQPYRF